MLALPLTTPTLDLRVHIPSSDILTGNLKHKEGSSGVKRGRLGPKRWEEGALGAPRQERETLG